MLQLVQSARAILEYFTERNEAALQRMPPGLRRDTQQALRRLESCSGAAKAQQWLQSLYMVASVVNPALSWRESQQIWGPVSASRCARPLPPVGKAWVSLFAAVGARDGSKMADIGEDILPRSGQFPESWRSYAPVAAMVGNGARGNWTKSSELWTRLQSRSQRPPGRGATAVPLAARAQRRTSLAQRAGLSRSQSRFTLRR